MNQKFEYIKVNPKPTYVYSTWYKQPLLKCDTVTTSLRVADKLDLLIDLFALFFKACLEYDIYWL